MADSPYELQLYQVRYRLEDRTTVLRTYVAVEGAAQGSMDDAIELAEAVRDGINDETGMDYDLRYLSCMGTIYVWRKDNRPPR